MTTLQGSFYDALTGETVVRDLTEEEIAELPQPAPVDELVTEEPPALEEEAGEA